MDILEDIGSRRELVAVLRRRQMAFLGHIMRANGLENLAITGRISGNRGRGRPRKKYLDRMKEVIGGVTTQELLGMTRDRDRWRFFFLLQQHSRSMLSDFETISKLKLRCRLRFQR